MKKLTTVQKGLLIISLPLWAAPYLVWLLTGMLWKKKYRVRFLLWKYKADIEKLITCFLDDKYPGTGIAKTPGQLIEQCKKEYGWKARKFNRIIAFCVECDIIQDHPMNKNRNSKQFFYILNPEYLK